MKRFTLYLFFVALMSFSANAQLADGTVAPDFTATDIDGNTHNLYSYLADGYTVILDISATWCGPCWGYHETHALSDTYNNLGPDGWEKVMVIWVEGDASTGLADIEGTGGATQGDWTAGTPFPIIDDASIASSYAISYYPTIYKICPDGNTVYEIGQASAEAIDAESLVAGCGLATSAVDGGVYNSSVSFCEADAPSTVEAEVINLGTSNLTSASFDLVADGSVIATESWTGSLSSFARGTVSIDASGVDGSASMYEIKMNLAGDEVPASDNSMLDVTIAPIANMLDLELEVKTDQYGYETYWEVRDDMGTVHASGGNPAVGPTGGGAQSVTSGGYAANSTILETFSVPAGGCYELFVVDDWGDGICCSYGNGSFTLMEAGGGPVVLTGGQFGATVSALADVRGSGSTGIEELDLLNEMVLYPNPTSTEINVMLESSEIADVQVLVTNAIGQVVNAGLTTTLATGKQVFTLDVSNLTEGLYFVAVQGENGQRTESFMIAR